MRIYDITVSTKNDDDRDAFLILYQDSLKVDLRDGKESEANGFQHTDKKTEKRKKSYSAADGRAAGYIEIGRIQLGK